MRKLANALLGLSVLVAFSIAMVIAVSGEDDSFPACEDNPACCINNTVYDCATQRDSAHDEKQE